MGFRLSFSNVRFYVTRLPVHKGHKPGQFSTFIQSNQSIIGHPTFDGCILSIESVISSLYRKSVERVLGSILGMRLPTILKVDSPAEYTMEAIVT